MNGVLRGEESIRWSKVRQSSKKAMNRDTEISYVNKRELKK